MLRYPEKTDVYSLDLSLFDIDENDKKRQEKKRQARINRFKDPNSSLSKKGNWFVWILLAACVLCAFFIYSSGKIKLDGINSESSAVARRVDEASKENLRLQAALEAIATPADVERYAVENGLIKELNSQVTQIYVSVEKPIEVAEPRNNDILSKINKWFSEKIEHLGF
ncbi:MAG: hypothetical protein FWH07_04395 [Oscillospiraceae bacterium]|nr:hypothetical protein [Oscillospiraceae bacterium]